MSEFDLSSREVFDEQIAVGHSIKSLVEDIKECKVTRSRWAWKKADLAFKAWCSSYFQLASVCVQQGRLETGVPIESEISVEGLIGLDTLQAELNRLLRVNG